MCSPPPLAGGAICIDIQWDLSQKKLLSLRSKLVPSAGEKPHKATAAHLFPAAGKTTRLGKKVVGQIPERLAPLKKRENSNALSLLFCKSMREAVGAEIAFHGTLSNYVFRGGPLREKQIFLLAPYENPLVTLPLTKEECNEILKEQYALSGKGYFQAIHGVEPSPLPAFPRNRRKGFSPPGNRRFYFTTPSGEKRLWENGEKLAVFTAYTLSGAGGRFPRLREIGKAKADKVRFHTITVREALHRYIKKHYPPSPNYRHPNQKGSQK